MFVDFKNFVKKNIMPILHNCLALEKIKTLEIFT